MNIENCPRCGRIYTKNPRGYCPACIKDIDKEYDACVTYLKEHRMAALAELSSATGVPVHHITHFIREGRISLADNPNLHLNCELCGTPVRDARLCGPCRTRLQSGSSSKPDPQPHAAPAVGERFFTNRSEHGL